MAQFTGTGTCLSVSAAAPTAHTAAAFLALTYTAVGELETLGEINIRHEAITFSSLCTGKTSTLKGAEQGIEVDVGVAMDRKDAGQLIVSNARKSLTARLAFRIVDSAGDIAYFSAFVMGERIAGGAGVNDIRMNVYALGVIAPATGDTVIVVPLP
jgi:hypothetical protein